MKETAGQTKKRDQLFDNHEVREDFRFTARVAEVFDDMINRSIPHHDLVMSGMADLLRLRVQKAGRVYDLGCATGSTLLKLSQTLASCDLHYIGIDNAPAMLEKARLKAAAYGKTDILQFKEADLSRFTPEQADVILCNYTLQFLRPIIRADFIQRLYQSLNDGGMLIISEKVICHDPGLNRDFIKIYHQFKRQQGYSELEISSKREALENILIPFSIHENMALLHQAGFNRIEPFFQWFNFCAFIAIKSEQSS